MWAGEARSGIPENLPYTVFTGSSELSKKGARLPLMRALPFMAASGRSSSEEDMTTDARELLNDPDACIEAAGAYELNDFKSIRQPLTALLKVGEVFVVENGGRRLTG